MLVEEARRGTYWSSAARKALSPQQLALSRRDEMLDIKEVLNYMQMSEAVAPASSSAEPSLIAVRIQSTTLGRVRQTPVAALPVRVQAPGCGSPGRAFLE